MHAPTAHLCSQSRCSSTLQLYAAQFLSFKKEKWRLNAHFCSARSFCSYHHFKVKALKCATSPNKSLEAALKSYTSLIILNADLLLHLEKGNTHFLSLSLSGLNFIILNQIYVCTSCVTEIGVPGGIIGVYWSDVEGCKMLLSS